MKVINCFKHLSNVEKNRFLKFVSSSYFNKNQNISNALLTIDKSVREGREIEKLDLWNSVFDKDKFDDSKLRKLLTDLMRLFTEFLAHEQFQNQQYLKNRLLLKKAQEIGCTNYFSAEIKKIQNRLKNETQTTIEFFFDQYLLRKQIFEIKELNYEDISRLHSSDIEINVCEVNQNLDTVYLIEKMRLATILKNLYILNLSNTELPYNEQVISWALNWNDSISKLPKIYADIQLLYNGQLSDKDIDNKIDTLFSNSDSLTKKELKDLYEHYQNYYHLQINSGQTKYFSKVLKLYKNAIGIDLLLEGDKINHSDYRNICVTAARAKEFHWALHFIEEYKTKLRPEVRESAYSFNKARVFGNMKDWESVIETLRNVEYEDLTYNLNSKLILMIAYYELEETFVLDSFIKSFKVFLRRRRNIPKARKESFLGFTNVLSNIMKADDKSDHKRIDIANNELESNASIPNKKWLLEKIEEVQSKIGVEK